MTWTVIGTTTFKKKFPKLYYKSSAIALKAKNEKSLICPPKSQICSSERGGRNLCQKYQDQLQLFCRHLRDKTRWEKVQNERLINLRGKEGGFFSLQSPQKLK